MAPAFDHESEPVDCGDADLRGADDLSIQLLNERRILPLIVDHIEDIIEASVVSRIHEKRIRQLTATGRVDIPCQRLRLDLVVIEIGPLFARTFPLAGLLTPISASDPSIPRIGRDAE